MKGSRKSRTRKAGGFNLGDKLIRGLTEFRDALATDEPLAKKFTVRTVRMPAAPRVWRAGEVRSLRERLGASQTVFAAAIGASAKTVQSWEQGKTPPPMASRLLECIENDPAHWQRMLHNSAIVRKAS